LDGRVTPGSEYERLSVTTYATHDHKPLRALWEEAGETETPTSSQARADLEKIAQFANIPVLEARASYDRDFYLPAMEALFRSEAWIVAVMITDLLGRKDRFNVPGTAIASNWSRRMHLTVARLNSSPGVKQRTNAVRKLLESSERL
jgi:4-alpha-glucanotransferase